VWWDGGSGGLTLERVHSLTISCQDAQHDGFNNREIFAPMALET
jgi:hypothetical protein